MRIVVFESGDREAAALEPLKTDHEVLLFATPLTAAEADRAGDADIVSTFIYSQLDRRVLERLPRLKFIATRSTGYDHIDIAYCAERGITVSNVPTYGDSTVAEHVFAMLLTISHRILDAVETVRRGRFSPVGLEGFDLLGKTFGVIGTGSIGRHAIQIARGFGMSVVAHDLRPDFRAAEMLGFRYVPLAELLAQADIVSLHVPGTPATRHLLGEREFAQMKAGAIVINTARGDVIDTRALVQALMQGKVAAAGLDVLPDEPVIREEAELLCSLFCDRHDLRTVVADHMLLRMRNVVVTPHSAFNTREAVQRIIETTVGNIRAFIKGQSQNVVGGPVGLDAHAQPTQHV